MERSIADFDAKIYNYTACSFSLLTKRMSSKHFRTQYAHFKVWRLRMKSKLNVPVIFEIFPYLYWSVFSVWRSWAFIAGCRSSISLGSELGLLADFGFIRQISQSFYFGNCKEKNYTENSRGSFTLISARTNRSCWERFQSYRYEWNISSSRASEQLTNLFQL